MQVHAWVRDFGRPLRCRRIVRRAAPVQRVRVAQRGESEAAGVTWLSQAWAPEAALNEARAVIASGPPRSRGPASDQGERSRGLP